jgi:hypothetical protein
VNSIANRTILRYLLSLLIGIAVALAARYYALHSEKSKTDPGAAWSLGVLTAVFFYVFVSTKLIPLIPLNASIKKELQKEEEENKRLYPAPAAYDHDFYHSGSAKALMLFILLAGMAAVIYIAFLGRYLVAATIALPVGVLLPSATREFFDKSPQVRISDTGIFIKGFGFRPWWAVKKIDLVKESSGRMERPMLKLYLAKNDPDYPAVNTALGEIKNWKAIGPLLQSMNKVTINNEC